MEEPENFCKIHNAVWSSNASCNLSLDSNALARLASALVYFGSTLRADEQSSTTFS